MPPAAPMAASAMADSPKQPSEQLAAWMCLVSIAIQLARMFFQIAAETLYVLVILAALFPGSLHSPKILLETLYVTRSDEKFRK